VAIEKALIEFETDDASEVVAAIAALHDGEWLNLEPYVAPQDLDELRDRTPHPLVRMFMKAGAPIPLGTIMRNADTLSIGLEHPHAAKAIAHLRDNGVDTPRAWKVKQDHPRRGIVLEVVATTAPEAIVTWITGAGRVLGAVPVGRAWTALVCTKGPRP